MATPCVGEIALLPVTAFEHIISQLNKPGELPLLLRDPVRVSVLVFRTGVRSGLLDELVDVFPYQGNIPLELGD
jgi:hypothetical protein